jgi:hypothetical protein
MACVTAFWAQSMILDYRDCGIALMEVSIFACSQVSVVTLGICSGMFQIYVGVDRRYPHMMSTVWFLSWFNLVGVAMQLLEIIPWGNDVFIYSFLPGESKFYLAGIIPPLLVGVTSWSLYVLWRRASKHWGHCFRWSSKTRKLDGEEQERIQQCKKVPRTE